MASTTDLGKWMLTNGGEYNPETAYEQLTMVMYENSTYITLKTVQGITPTDDHVNYQLMAKGFNPTALASVQATDTSGVLGEAGGTVSAQDLVDWVVDQAANKLLKLTDLVSVQTNDATKGVSAALAYAMNQKIEQTNSNFEGRTRIHKVQNFEGYTSTSDNASVTIPELIGAKMVWILAGYNIQIFFIGKSNSDFSMFGSRNLGASFSLTFDPDTGTITSRLVWNTWDAAAGYCRIDKNIYYLK